jgi:PAS domain S-box-containing protein
LEFLPSTDFRTIFNAHPGASALVLPDSPFFTVVGSTDEFAAFAGTEKQNLIGKSLFTYFPDNPNAPNVSDNIRASLEICIAAKRKNELAVQRYDITRGDGTFYEMYWTVIHTPIFDESENLIYIIHTAVDVTDKILSNIKDQKIKELEPVQNLFSQSAVAIHIFKGPDLIIYLANEPTLKMWDKDLSVIGKPLREALPEIVSQDYIDIINRVRITGIPYQAHEAPVILFRNGKEETGFFNFILQPYYEKDKTAPVGVIAMANEVTDILHDKKVLAEKERSLELAAEIGDLGIFSIDMRSNTVSYSPQIMEWFGVGKLNLSLEELLAKVHPEDYTFVNDTLSRISQGLRSRRHDITFRVPHPKTGDLQYLRSIGQIQEEDGEIITLSGIIQDITPMIQSRLAVEQSAQQLKSLIYSAPFPIAVYTGREMRIEIVNQAVLDAWGRDLSVIGKTYSEVMTELVGTGIYEQLDHVFTSGEAFHASNQKLELGDEGNLKTYYFNYSFTPLFDASDEVYGIMNTAANVTDLNITQKALAESERNFRTMILLAPVAMCLMRGPEHVIEIANKNMITLWGKTKQQVMNRPVFDALPDAREQGLEEMLDHVYKTGETFSAQEHAVSLERFGNTEIVYQNFVYEPYRDGEGNIIGVLAISINVTDQVLARHKIEEVVRERTKELADTNQRLQSTNAELEQFAYIASHDLQEPLRKINMFAGLLGNSLENPSERTQKHLDSIGISVQRMTNLIHDILSYSQLSQKQEVFREIDLEEIFYETISDFDLIVEEKQGNVSHSNLPVIEAIPLQMVQLFHNLISNGLKYSRPDVPPRIGISSESLSHEEAAQLGLPLPGTPYCKLVFTDNGIGFSPEYETKIFNIFHRLHGKGQYEGTGIGLAMCKKIAENHNGIIFANGTEGKGATFTVILPTRQA